MSAPSTREGELPDEENLRLFVEDIVPAHLQQITPQRAPIAVLIVGPTGAGKSLITARVRQILHRRGEPAWINMDFYNPHHPHYARWRTERPQDADALVRRDGDKWWAQAQQYALARRADIVLESAAVTEAEFEHICQRINTHPVSAGQRRYRVESVFVAVPGPVSSLGVRERFLREVDVLGHGRRIGTAIETASRRGEMRAATAFERDGLGSVGAVLHRNGAAVAIVRLTPGQHTSESQPRLAAAIRRVRDTPLPEPDAMQFAAHLVSVTLRAPRDMVDELNQIARDAVSLMPDGRGHWLELTQYATSLRASPYTGQPGARLRWCSDDELTDRLAASIVMWQSPGSPGPAHAPETGPGAAILRVLNEMSRRTTLTPQQRAVEGQARERFHRDGDEAMRARAVSLLAHSGPASAALLSQPDMQKAIGTGHDLDRSTPGHDINR
ncbi:zeta toxin family protein [Nocardia terpenica]|uniref:UDP-N-acetylglucosamine kinase n=1 Tax=Nocardia terpenica TaxID=455432 RepID=A0A6G9ZDY3_9NOCA|nr:zeta toxin family protein [Nocardia terpenica]QIS23650.1 hypothetical protein F6W96_40660 [Nocardia terpenica]